MAACEGCKLEDRVKALEKRQESMEKLVTSVATLAVELGHMKDDMSEIKADVKALTERPAKRWDLIVTAIITGVVSFVIGMLLRGGA